MQSVILLAIFLFFATPAARLAWLRARSGGGPEGALSVFFLGMGLGVPLRLYQASRPALSQEGLQVLGFAGVVCLLVALLSLMLFTQQVFRPESRIARAWVVGSALYLVATLCGLVYVNGLVIQTHPLSLAANVWGLTAFGWTFAECLSHHQRLRRQQKLGMGDPLVRNRFALWSVWTGAFVLLPLVTLAVKTMVIAQTPEGAEVVAAPPPALAFLRSVILAIGLTGLTSIWISFFPPNAYVRWIRDRASRDLEPSEAASA